jgi:hypothetical protein
MKNILMLYNPYYQKDVIEQHIDVLLNADTQTVAFGKVRSKLRDYEHPFSEVLNRVYDAVDDANYVQLFLTDYASMYVARVIKVDANVSDDIKPSYYKEKNLEVEQWFVISDMRRVVHNDFERVRDEVLGNFTVPNFGGHHYAVYGNEYVYPLMVEQDKPLDYFEDVEDGFRYCVEMFKSKKSLELKQQLIDYRFGSSIFHAFHPNTQDALIAAEMEFHENKDDPLYDFTSVVIKLSKAFEEEVYLFMRVLFEKLMMHNCDLEEIAYSVQGRDYVLYDYLSKKPNLGTTSYLLKHYAIKNTMKEHIKDTSLIYFSTVSVPAYIKFLQPIRNESVHGEAASLADCIALRKKMVGIGENGILCELVLKK